MWRLDRGDDRGNWTTMMASPHRVRVSDLHGPHGDSNHNFLDNAPSRDTNTVFTGKPGWHARIRHDDTVVEFFDWDLIPENEFEDPNDPETRMLWGWKLVEKNNVAFEEMWPLSFVG